MSKSETAVTEVFRSRPNTSHYLVMDLRLIDICDGRHSEALVLRKLMDWAEAEFKRHAVRYPQDDLAGPVKRSLSQLEGDCLLLYRQDTIRDCIKSLVQRGLVVEKVAPPDDSGYSDNIPLRYLNVPAINGLLLAWEDEKSAVRKTRIALRSYVLQTKNERGVWETRTGGRPKTGAGGPGKIHGEGPGKIHGGPGICGGDNKEYGKDILTKDENSMKSDTPPRPVNGIVDGMEEEKVFPSNSPAWDFPVPTPTGKLVHGNILDTASPQELLAVKRLVWSIKEEDLLPFQFPKPDKPIGKALYQTIVNLLEILRGSWNPDVPFEYRFRPATIREFRDKILAAARKYRQRVETLCDRPHDLHYWIFNNHITKEARTSALLQELTRIEQDTVRQDSGDLLGQAAKRLGPVDYLVLTNKLNTALDKNPPHPNAFWRRVLDLADFCDERELDIRFHGIISKGWFRAPDRKVSPTEILYLYSRYRAVNNLSPTAWIPAVADEEWKRFAQWLRGMEGEEEFVDLDFQSTLSDSEREEAIVADQVVRIRTALPKMAEYKFSKEVVLAHIQEQAPNVTAPSVALFLHITELLQLSKACRTGMGGVNRKHALIALERVARAVIRDLRAGEEMVVAVVGFNTLAGVREYWAENDPLLLRDATMAELLKGVAPDDGPADDGEDEY